MDEEDPETVALPTLCVALVVMRRNLGKYRANDLRSMNAACRSYIAAISNCTIKIKVCMRKNAQMNQTIRLTSTTSDQTVLTLQQRCRSAEYKNLQYDKEIALLKQPLKSDAKAPDLMRNFASMDEATTALLSQRDDTIADLCQQCLQYSQQLTLVQDLAHRTSAVVDLSSI